jgi:hypothetical protein
MQADRQMGGREGENYSYGIGTRRVGSMKNKIINLSPILLIVILASEFFVTFLLGFFFKDYSHIEMVMSELGSASSPVAFWMSLYWVIYGIVFILFGYSFYQTYQQNRVTQMVGYLFILIGIGAGWFSAFPMDVAGAAVTLPGTLHNIGSGIGFLAMFMIPFLLLRFFEGESHKILRIFLISIQVFVVGQSVILLFLVPVGNSGYSIYIGLWQRLYLAAYYVVFTMLALRKRYKELD